MPHATCHTLLLVRALLIKFPLSLQNEVAAAAAVDSDCSADGNCIGYALQTHKITVIVVVFALRRCCRTSLGQASIRSCCCCCCDSSAFTCCQSRFNLVLLLAAVVVVVGSYRKNLCKLFVFFFCADKAKWMTKTKQERDYEVSLCVRVSWLQSKLQWLWQHLFRYHCPLSVRGGIHLDSEPFDAAAARTKLGTKQIFWFIASIQTVIRYWS